MARAENLQRHAAVQRATVDSIDDAAPALTEHALHGIAGESGLSRPARRSLDGHLARGGRRIAGLGIGRMSRTGPASGRAVRAPGPRRRAPVQGRRDVLATQDGRAARAVRALVGHDATRGGANERCVDNRPRSQFSPGP